LTPMALLLVTAIVTIMTRTSTLKLPSCAETLPMTTVTVRSTKTAAT